MARFQRRTAAVEISDFQPLSERDSSDFELGWNSLRSGKCPVKEMAFATVILLLVLAGAIALGLIYQRQPPSEQPKPVEEERARENTISWKIVAPKRTPTIITTQATRRLSNTTQSSTPVVILTNDSVSDSYNDDYTEWPPPEDIFPVPVTQVETGKWYNVMSHADGRVMTTSGRKAVTGARLGLWGLYKGADQRFRFQKVINSSYLIEEGRGGKFVVYKTPNNTMTVRSGTIQLDDMNFLEKWTVKPVPENNATGLVQIENILHEKCLERQSERFDDLKAMDCTSQDNQLWRLIPVCE